MSIFQSIRNHIRARGILKDFSKYTKDQLSKERNRDSKDLSLFELNINYSGHIGYASFAASFLEQGHKLVGYSPESRRGLKSRFAFWVFSKPTILLSTTRPFYLYRLLGVTKFLNPKLSKNEEFRKYINFKSKNDVLVWRLDGILIGDLFYDWHLRKREIPTITLGSDQFDQDLEIFYKHFKFWSAYFSSHEVQNVVVSHGVYIQGLVARVGIKYGSKVYLVSAERVYQLSEANLLSDREYLEYDPTQLNQQNYEIDLFRAQHQLKNVLENSAPVNSAHSSLNGFAGFSYSKNLKPERESLGVLIACHCFSDSPHADGGSLFPDFWEWLIFLGEKSLLSNENWFIKAHPAFTDSDWHWYKDFCELYPAIIPIDSQISNLSLYEECIDVVLTVHGTIAFEAAYLGIPVINASLNSPHVRYPFSISPQNTKEYDEIISNLKQVVENFTIDKCQVLHFYDLHHVRRMGSWLFGNHYVDFLSCFPNYKDRFESLEVLSYFIRKDKNRNLILESKILLNKFIADDSYKLHQVTKWN